MTAPIYTDPDAGVDPSVGVSSSSPPPMYTSGGVPPTTTVSGTNSTTEWLNSVTSRVINSTAEGASRQLTMIADRAAIPLIYGEDRVGAMVLNVIPIALGGVDCIVAQCLWGYACDSMVGTHPTYNDEPLPPVSDALGVVHFFYDGHGSDSVYSAFASAFQAAAGVPYTDTLAGWCVSYVYIPVNKFTGVLKFEAVLKGRRVYDPRTTTTVWSDNPALCLADFLESTDYGCGKTVDDTALITAANANDELVSSEKRRTLNVTLTSMQPARSVAETLRAYAGCFLLPGAGGIKLVPDRPGSSVATYTHADGQIAAIRVSKKDSGNFPTQAEVVYTNRTVTPWKDDSVFVPPDSEITGPLRLTSVSMPGISRYSQARREAYERLNKLQTSDLNVTLDVFDIGIKHEQGDIITVTHPVGLSSKLLRIGEIEALPNALWRLTCAEYDPAGYSDDAAVGPTYPDTGFTNPQLAPATPTGLAYAFSTNGIELSWTRNPELTVTEYELRVGSTWNDGDPLLGMVPTLVGGTTFTWPAQTAGSYTVWIKARTGVGVESATAASLAVTIAAPTLTSLTQSLSGANAVLTWSLASNDLPVKFYRVRKAGTLLAEVNSTRYETPVDWTGDKAFTVAAVDIGDNEGSAASTAITINGPGAVASFTATVVVNTVLFYWSPPALMPLPIAYYLMKKGTTWAGATSIGDKAGDSTFTTYFEGDAATNTYWIAPVDTAGNEGTPTSISVQVDAPSGFRLQSDFADDFSGTKTDVVAWDGALIGPVDDAETFQTHFSGAYSTPEGQITAGYEIYAEPSVASGTYVQTFDATEAASNLSSSLITVDVTGAAIDGSPTLAVKIETATHEAPTTWTDLGTVTQAFASNFRYVRVTLTFGSSGGDDLYRVTALHVKLALKTETDAGSKLASAFSGGKCAVTFTKDFVDVDAITVTPLGTAVRTCVVDFTDAPNPTGFDVYIWNSAGTATPTDFTWTAVGVI